MHKPDISIDYLPSILTESEFKDDRSPNEFPFPPVRSNIWDSSSCISVTKFSGNSFTTFSFIFFVGIYISLPTNRNKQFAIFFL